MSDAFEKWRTEHRHENRTEYARYHDGPINPKEYEQWLKAKWQAETADSASEGRT